MLRAIFIYFLYIKMIQFPQNAERAQHMPGAVHKENGHFPCFQAMLQKVSEASGRRPPA